MFTEENQLQRFEIMNLDLHVTNGTFVPFHCHTTKPAIVTTPTVSVAMTCAELQAYSPPAQVSARTSSVEPANASRTPKKSIAANFLFHVSHKLCNVCNGQGTHCFQLPCTFFNGMKKNTHAVVKTLKNRFKRKIHLL